MHMMSAADSVSVMILCTVISMRWGRVGAQREGEVMRRCCTQYGHYVKQTLVDVRKRKLSYCLGFGSCLVVVFVFALAQSALGVVPAVILRLGETTNCEVDSKLLPMCVRISECVTQSVWVWVWVWVWVGACVPRMHASSN